MKPSQQKILIESLATQQLNKERKFWIDRCISAITASVAADLLDKWDWSTDQVSELLSSTSSNFEAMLDKFVTLDDFYKWLDARGIHVE